MKNKKPRDVLTGLFLFKDLAADGIQKFLESLF